MSSKRVASVPILAHRTDFVPRKITACIRNLGLIRKLNSESIIFDINDELVVPLKSHIEIVVAE